MVRCPRNRGNYTITTDGVGTIDVNRVETVHSVLIDAPNATVMLNSDLSVAGDFVLDTGTVVFNGGTLCAGSFTQSGGTVPGDMVDTQSAPTVALNGGSILPTATLSATGQVLQGFTTW
jgi:hypothetical protein